MWYISCFLPPWCCARHHRMADFPSMYSTGESFPMVNSWEQYGLESIDYTLLPEIANSVIRMLSLPEHVSGRRSPSPLSSLRLVDQYRKIMENKQLPILKSDANANIIATFGMDNIPKSWLAYKIMDFAMTPFWPIVFVILKSKSSSEDIIISYSEAMVNHLITCVTIQSGDTNGECTRLEEELKTTPLPFSSFLQHQKRSAMLTTQHLHRPIADFPHLKWKG